MSLVKPIVLKAGEIEVLQLVDQLVDNTILFVATNEDATSTAIGSVMGPDGAGGVIKAKADGSGSGAFCFATEVIASSASGIFQIGGLIVGFSGLSPGSVYYLSPTTFGAITTTAPSSSGQEIIRLGIAVTSTTLAAQIQRPINLA